VLRLVEGIDKPSPLDGGLDKGREADERVRPCARHPWCIEAAGHAGDCTLKDGRTLYEPPTYAPGRR
jgi:hypothetical protein